MSDRYTLHRVRLLVCGLVFLGLTVGFGSAFSAEVAAQATPAASATDAHPEFPLGPGRDTTLKVCSQCHSPNNVLTQRRDRQGWKDIITKMVGYGASGTDEEFAEILDYVSKDFPATPGTRVNINSADAAHIAAGLSLSVDEAKAIVAFREKHGRFKSFTDIRKVPGVDARKLDGKRDAVEL